MSGSKTSHMCTTCVSSSIGFSDMMLVLVSSHEGAPAVQQLIDAGAYICFQEENGLEMVAEFTRSVGGDGTAKKSFETDMDRYVFVHCFGHISIFGGIRVEHLRTF